MYVLAMIEVMSLSGHLSNIDEIKSRWNTYFYSIHLMLFLILSQVINWDFYIIFQVIQAVEDFVLETRFKKVILAENIWFKNSDGIMIKNIEAFRLENLDEFGILSEFFKNSWRMLLLCPAFLAIKNPINRLCLHQFLSATKIWSKQIGFLMTRKTGH